MGTGPLPTSQDTRPVAERHQVGGTQIDARQETRQPRGRRHVVAELQSSAHILHGRLVEQPAQPHNLRGDPRLTKRSVDQREVLAAPAQDGNASARTVLARP